MNGWEAASRRKKAERLASVLFIDRVPSARVADLNAELWSATAAKAGVHPPNSEETKQLVAEILKEKELEETCRQKS